jgi:hypothetical protein
MTPAGQTLERLLRRGERARARGVSERVTLAMTPASCPEYCALDTLEALEAFHAEIALAERAAAVTAERTRTGGDSRGLKRISLADLERLGSHLGIRLLSARAQDAEALLMPWSGTYPVVSRVLAAWQQGRKVRGCGPDAAQDLLDAIRVVESRRRDGLQERILRRESVRLFDDSKRLERLTAWLDVLNNDELAATGLSSEDVWSALGLRREPQPMLVAGRGAAILQQGTVPLCRPYLGLPMDAVTTIETDARYLLTIENLASFHDAARAMPDADGLLIYTAGMPSPAWRSLYRRIVASLPRAVELYHWGDIDEGGYRIAAVISEAAKQAGGTLQPWRMSPDEVSTALSTPNAATASTAQQMVRWANACGWSGIARELERSPITLEQEALDPSFP